LYSSRHESVDRLNNLIFGANKQKALKQHHRHYKRKNGDRGQTNDAIGLNAGFA
jgi:hypothetical protein